MREPVKWAVRPVSGGGGAARVTVRRVVPHGGYTGGPARTAATTQGALRDCTGPSALSEHPLRQPIPVLWIANGDALYRRDHRGSLLPDGGAGDAPRAGVAVSRAPQRRRGVLHPR